MTVDLRGAALPGPQGVIDLKQFGPRPKPQRRDTVSVSWVSPGEVSTRFMTSIVDLYTADFSRPADERRILVPGGGYTHMISGPRIASARNQLVRSFLYQHTADWLLMVDTDMVFSPDILDKLLEVADAKTRPVVGALCFGGGKGRLFPTMYRLQNPAEHDGSPIGYVEEWTPGELVQVDATGAAFLLMSRGVLAAMVQKYPEPTPWFAESQYQGIEIGEDWTFCLRAGSMNVPIYVHTGASIGHEKSVILDEQVWRSGAFGLEMEGRKA